MLSIGITGFCVKPLRDSGVMMSIGLLVVTTLILWQVGWTRLVDTVEQQHGVGGFNRFFMRSLDGSMC
jgi:hypothetical protein